MSFILAFLSTSLGKYIVGGIGIAGALAAAWLRAKALGRKEQAQKQAASDAKAASEAQKIDDAVAGRAPDDNRERLSRWSKQ